MQKGILIETRSVADEKGTLLNLKYYLIEEEPPQSAAPLYRICIKKSIAEHPGVEETESTPPVSDSELFTRQVLKQLIQNAVTPVCLLEIVDDMITREDGQASLKRNDMQEQYKFTYAPGTGEIVEKKSRFIATVTPVKTEEEAIKFIEQCRKQYWDASHNCTAFTIGSRHQLTRCSDDGEPAGTAGRPMLDVLLGEDVHDTAVVVTRYFGGTLLGTGGLVRAYSKAVQEGLSQAVILEKHRGKHLGIHTDYNDFGKVQYLLGQNQISILHADYADTVSLEVLVPCAFLSKLTADLTDGTGGRTLLEEGNVCWYAISDGEILLFEEEEA